MRGRAISRRRFLIGAAAGAAAPYVITSSALGGAGRAAASERIGLGFIGCGNRMGGLIHGFCRRGDTQGVAVCDVYRHKRQASKHQVDRIYAGLAAGGKYTGCAAYNDFRELLARDDVDAVAVATPDHWHVLISIAAAAAGKDVYCEKPLSLTIAEGRALVGAFQRYGRVFQHGTQLRSGGGARLAGELVQNGRIGRLHTIRVGDPPGGITKLGPPAPVPEGFDYDQWLGQAPWSPYCSGRCNRGWMFNIDYSIGFLAGWGVHDLDLAQFAHGTERTGPVEVEGVGSAPANALGTINRWHVEFLFADGVKLIFTTSNENRVGARLEGTEGWVFTRGGISAHPKSLLRSVIGPGEIHLYRSSNHGSNFLECVRTRRATIAGPEVAHRSTTLCHLAHIAITTGRKLKWDPKRERFANDDQANRMLARAMRPPWRL